MVTEPTYAAQNVKPSTGANKLQRDLADDVENEFGPLVAQFGFEPAGWDDDGESGLVRVNFEHPVHDDFVQLHARLSDGHVMPVYCRIDGEWEICRSGKPKKFGVLKKILPRWLEANCGRCCAGCDQVTDPSDRDRYPPMHGAHYGKREGKHAL